MTPDCLIKLKPVVSDDVYAKLEDAVSKGDQKAWDFTMHDAHADMSLLKRQSIISANAKADMIQYIDQQIKGGTKAGRALSDMISGSGSRQGSGIVSLDKYIEGIRGSTLSKLVKIIHSNRPKFLGLNRSRDGEFAKNLVKNIFGDADASGAKGMDKMVDAWKQTTQDMMNRFNKAGGSITELEDFFIPVNHYSPSVTKAGEEQWVKDAKELFNLRRLPGREELSDEDLFRRIYKNISTEGGASLDPGAVPSRRTPSLANSHQAFRWLQPKNGEAWLTYTTKYGRHSSPVDAMIEYVDGMSTQIGLMERLGANPTKNFDEVVSHVAETTKSPGAGRMAKASLDQLISRNPGVESRVTDVLRGVRNFQTITKLGMAPITSLSDIAYSAIESKYLGMAPIKTFTRYMKNLNPLDNADRQLAGRMGLFMDYALSKAASLYRYSDTNGFGALHRAADFSTRASGLNHLTNTAKMSFGLEFLANMGEMSVKDYGSLSKGLKRAFERYGIDQDDWADISKALTTDRGVKYVDPTKLTDDDLMARVIGMVREETNFAVPEPNAKARAVATLGIPTNTVGNEVIKVAGQFKTFGVSIMLSHMGRMLDETSPIATRMGYGMTTLLTTSVLGVVVVQLKDIAKGREPREMSPKLAMEGFLQGGSTGVLGDIVFNNPELFGGFPAFIAGPSAADAQKLLQVMYGSVAESKELAEDWEKTLKKAAGTATVQTLGLPSRLWYTRVAMERLMLDDINKVADPAGYRRKLKRRRKFMKEDRGQGYWWKPGESKPEFMK